MHMKQISGLVHARQLQLYGMPMVGFGMVATYLKLPATGDTTKNCEYVLQCRTLTVQCFNTSPSIRKCKEKYVLPNLFCFIRMKPTHNSCVSMYM